MRIQNKRSLLLIIPIMAIVGAVIGGSLAGGRNVAVAEPQVPRDPVSGVAQTNSLTLVDGNNAFAFDLYRILRDEEGNVIFSPYSISAALAMTYAGAMGETERQMAETLRFTLPQDQLHPAFNALQSALNAQSEAGDPNPDDEAQPLELSIVNALWGQESFPFYDDYLNLIAANYGAGLTPMDFVSAAEESRQIINDWVNDQTRERIQNLIPPGALTPLTRLVLTNAIYFKASWASAFEEAATRDELFYLLDGEQVTVPMMNQTEQFAYMAGDGFQAVELPYEGGTAAMIVLLPEEGRFAEIEAGLDVEGFNAIRRGFAMTEVALSVPRFEYDSDFGLAGTLSNMGMVDAFDESLADFNGMAELRPGENLYISAVIHKAFVSVDESGTEAAAATAVIMGLTTAMQDPPEPVVFRADRPFSYIIYDQVSGSILFMGRVLNPVG